jgi:hypothetical protein
VWHACLCVTRANGRPALGNLPGKADCLLRIGPALLTHFVQVKNEMGPRPGECHRQHTEIVPNCGVVDLQALLVGRLCLTRSNSRITREHVFEWIGKDDFAELRPTARFDFGQAHLASFVERAEDGVEHIVGVSWPQRRWLSSDPDLINTGVGGTPVVPYGAMVDVKEAGNRLKWYWV